TTESSSAARVRRMVPEVRRDLRRGLIDVDRGSTRRHDECHVTMFGLCQRTAKFALTLLGHLRIGNSNKQRGTATGHAHLRISRFGYSMAQATKFWPDLLRRMFQFVAEPY